MTSNAKARQGVTTQIAKLIKDTLGSMHVPQMVYGVVAAHTTGPSRLTLTLQGTSTNVPGVRYLTSYSPTNGDTVVAVRYGTDLLVVGKVTA